MNRRLAEAVVGIGLVLAMAAVSFSPRSFFGQWGAEPTPELLAVWQSFVDAHPSTRGENGTQYRLLRMSPPREIRDAQIGRRIKVIRAECEIVEEGLPPRLEEFRIGFEGRRAVRWFYAENGPKEYRDAF